GHEVKQIASSVLHSLKGALHRAITVVGDALIDAFRGTVGAIFQDNSDVAIGWIWIANLSSACAACTAMHGSFHDLSEDLESHVHCECQQEIVTANSPDIQSGSDWFDEQDGSVQRDIIGSDVGYDLYTSGDASLDDFVGHASDPVWGKSI